MSLHLWIVAAYILLIVAIGVYTQKITKSSSAFTGAEMTIPIVVAAAVGEVLGGTATTGVSEYGYTAGFSGSWFTIANALGMLFLAIFLVRQMHSLGTITVPGIIERYLGVQARVVSSVLMIIVSIVVGTSQVIAAGTLGVTLLHLPFATAVMILGIAFIVYTWAGGMKAVGYTNLVHVVLMYGSVLLGAVYALKTLPHGYATLQAELPPKYFSFFGIGASKVWGWIVTGMLAICASQASLQPILAAKDVPTARTSTFLIALISAPFGLLTALLGMVARVACPNLPNAKLALPVLMMNLPPWIGGVVLAGILAAILSTVSPIILAVGTNFAKDLYQRVIKPDASDNQVLLAGRVGTGVAGLICIVLAIIFYARSTILDMVYSAYTLRAALFVVLLYAIFWRRTSPKGSVWSMILTAIVGFFWVAYKSRFGHFPIHPGMTETYAGLITCAISMYVFSIIFPREKREEPLPGPGAQA